MKISKFKILSPLFLLSAFSLNAADSSLYEYVAADVGDYNVVRYVENADGSYSTVTYGVSLASSTITGTYDTTVGTSYYNWDSATKSYVLIENWTEGTDYDFSALVNVSFGSVTSSTSLTQAIIDGYVGESVVFANSDAPDGGVYSASGKDLSGAGYSLNGIFIGNTAYKADATVAYGGALSFTTSCTLGTISGTFIANNASYGSATNSKGAAGGAIQLGGSGGSLVALNADFLNNYASDTSGTAGSSASGGAVNNAGKIGSLTGTYIGNYTFSTAGTAQGGAINNSGTIESLTADFLSNYASTTSGTAQGGAIKNIGTITFVTTNSSMQFTGNYVEVNGVKTSNAIYNSGTLNFSAGSASIFVNDGINGSEGKINITSGKTVFNNAVASQTITVSEYATLALGSVSIDGTSYSADLSGSSLVLSDNATLSFVVNAGTDSALNNIVFGGDSSLDLSGTDATASLDLTGIFGDFSLTLSFGDEAGALEMYTFLSDNLDVLFSDCDFNYEKTSDVTFTYNASEIEYVNVALSGSTITISGAVPEPSTYAMILGVLALGFAYYRRRK